MTFSIFLSKNEFYAKNCSFLTSTIRQVKFSLLRKNVSVVLKFRATSFEISFNSKEPSPVNTVSGVERPI